MIGKDRTRAPSMLGARWRGAAQRPARARLRLASVLLIGAAVFACARLALNAAVLTDMAQRVSAAIRLNTIVLLFAALLGACLIPHTAHAQSSALPACKQPPTSPVVVNVKDKGAKGNGRSDDTAAIQAAIDAVGGTQGTVFVPDGVYMVEAVTKRRLTLRGNMTFKMSPGAVLKAIPNSSVIYFVLTISGVANVTVTGGTLEGDRDKHKGDKGEWGIGLNIGRGARHITVNNVNSNRMWGDGFYVQGARNVTLCQVSADANRRQGLSIVEANGLIVTNSVFKNTQGTRPSGGIDLEPDHAAQKITNIHIRNSKFIDNAGGGILIAGQNGQISRVEISNNTITGRNAIDISHAPGVLDATICRNRQITTVKSESSGGLSTFEEPIKSVILQEDCGDHRLMKRKHESN